MLELCNDSGRVRRQHRFDTGTSIHHSFADPRTHVLQLGQNGGQRLSLKVSGVVANTELEERFHRCRAHSRGFVLQSKLSDFGHMLQDDLCLARAEIGKGLSAHRLEWVAQLQHLGGQLLHTLLCRCLVLSPVLSELSARLLDKACGLLYVFAAARQGNVVLPAIVHLCQDLVGPADSLEGCTGAWQYL